MMEKIKNWWKQNLANLITVIGTISSFYFLWIALTEPKSLLKISFSAFIAGITDFIDGPIARYFKSESIFGSYMDRIRDRILVYPGMIILGWQYRESITAPGILLALLISLAFFEILIFHIGAVGLWWHLKGKELDLSPNKYGKRKIFAGFTIIFIWIISIDFESLGFPLLKYSVWIIYFGLFLMVYWSYVSWGEYTDRKNSLKAQ